MNKEIQINLKSYQLITNQLITFFSLQEKQGGK